MENQVDGLGVNEVLFLGTTGMLIMAFGIILFIYGYQRKLIKRKLKLQEISDLLKKQELQSAYALIEGQEKERKRISQDLHDNLGSLLVTLNMYADTVKEEGLDKQSKNLLSKVKETAKQATSETRRISHNLDSGIVAHFGLEAAIKELVEAINTIRQTQMTFHVQISSNMNKDFTINLYRVIQELVNNTLKHAHASKIHIELSEVNHEYISFIYEDNGVGFDPNSIQSGIGLKNIESRIDALGGNLTIDSKTGKGSHFIAEIPIHE